MKKSMILLFMLFAFFFYIILDIITIIIIMPAVFLYYAIWSVWYSLDLYAKEKRCIIFLTMLIPSIIVAFLTYKIMHVVSVMFLLGFTSEIICHLLGYCIGYGYEGIGGEDDMIASSDVMYCNMLDNAIYFIAALYYFAPCDFFWTLVSTYYPMLLLNKIIPRRSDQY